MLLVGGCHRVLLNIGSDFASLFIIYFVFFYKKQFIGNYCNKEATFNMDNVDAMGDCGAWPS